MRLFPIAFALAAVAASCAENPNDSQSTGGKTGSGGTASKGGAPGTGGKTGSGGASSHGGTTSTGGSSTVTAVDCTDTSTYANTVSQQYGATVISLDNNSAKSYYMLANWWGSPYNNQTEDVKGIGFTITNPNNSVASSKPDLPLGYPSIFIGTYSSKRTTGSNLPKAVSSITSIPTILSTNVDSMGVAGYNASYDVWFTSGSGVVSGSNPGNGGAYLMVWLFKPSDKQPRGILRSNGSVITGVKGGWDVWYDPSPSDNMPCVSYVSSTKLSSLEFDLNYFIQDAIESGYGINKNQYLSIIFAGFEVWQGGNGLQLKKFCANVK